MNNFCDVLIAVRHPAVSRGERRGAASAGPIIAMALLIAGRAAASNTWAQAFDAVKDFAPVSMIGAR